MYIFINLHVLIAVFIKSAIQIDTDSIPKKHQYENFSFLFLVLQIQFFLKKLFKSSAICLTLFNLNFILLLIYTTYLIC